MQSNKKINSPNPLIRNYYGLGELF